MENNGTLFCVKVCFLLTLSIESKQNLVKFFVGYLGLCVGIILVCFGFYWEVCGLFGLGIYGMAA